ncbi:hypothetical protein [uncultured Methylophaga sp.]|uniref:hypothetical protein n=1 Tax=Methylophaga sp. TaxID=2024840 RepID=UPI0026154CCE|nr:hypothetical protein [uncultured Methylophaga sp.]
MRLKDEHIDYLLHLIDTWGIDQGILSIPKLLERLRLKYGNAPSDRTIRNHPRISNRVIERKTELKTGISKSSRKPSSLSHAAKRIEDLESKNRRLERENAALLHRFVVWQKNASDRGMTETDLNRPLPISQETIESSGR